MSISSYFKPLRVDVSSTIFVFWPEAVFRFQNLDLSHDYFFRSCEETCVDLASLKNNSRTIVRIFKMPSHGGLEATERNSLMRTGILAIFVDLDPPPSLTLTNFDQL